MKASSIFSFIFATLALLCGHTFTAGQALQRSMVYHATPPQTAPQSASRQAATVTQTASPQPSITKRAQATPHVAAQVAAVKQTSHNAQAQQVNHVINPVPTVSFGESSNAAKASTPAAEASVTVAYATPTNDASAKNAATKDNAVKDNAVKDSVAVRRTFDKPMASSRKPFDRWFAISSIVFAAGAIMDHQSTVAGMKRVGAREANPLLRNSDGSFSPAKHLALTAGIYGASFALQRKHPRMANALRLVGGFASTLR